MTAIRCGAVALLLLSLAAVAAAQEESSAQEEKAAAEAVPCSAWDVDVRNRGDADVAIYPFEGDEIAELEFRSTVAEQTGLRSFLVTVHVNGRVKLRVGGSRPVLVFFASDPRDASGFSPERLVGWSSPQETKLRGIRGLRLDYSCTEEKE